MMPRIYLSLRGYSAVHQTFVPLRALRHIWQLRWMFILLLLVLLFLLLSGPVRLQKPCPLVSRHRTLDKDWKQDPGAHSATDLAAAVVDCSTYFTRDGSKQLHENHNWCQPLHSLASTDYLNLVQNCDKFLDKRGYRFHHVTDEEKSFPLALSIVMRDNVEQAERLLRAIYRPHNVYCVHVDKKAPPSVRAAMEGIAGCLPNVKLLSTIVVSWAEFSLLEAELSCLRELWTNPSWKYYLNLSGQDFPIRTNWELVRILKAYNGANEIDGSFYRLVYISFVFKYE